MVNKVLKYNFENYKDTGVCFPLKVLSTQELAYFQKAYQEFESFFGGKPEKSNTKQLHLFFSWAYELAMHPVALDEVQKVLGADILIHSTSVFNKKPGDLNFVSWHQDGYYSGLNKPQFVSGWIALSDSTPENGCMQVVPGTHKKHYIHVEKPENNNMLSSGLTLGESIDQAQAENVSLKAGEMSLHHVNIVHGSSPNNSTTQRTGFAVRYISPDVKQELPHFDVVLARGEDNFHNYSLLQSPPKGSIRECVEKQAVFFEDYSKRRIQAQENSDQK